MMQVVPRYQVYWELDCDKPNTGAVIINANNINEALKWFNNLNFGLRNITLLQIKLINENLKQEGSFQENIKEK
jgi:nicotinic acid phosphoribosyltransferase